MEKNNKLVNKLVLETSTHQYYFEDSELGKKQLKKKIRALKDLLIDYKVYLCNFKALSCTCLNVTALY